ncbi:MAG TPA: YCF48-related protein [bacterium]|nr:YCF48-related protein [bacterium]HPN45581.1 YCF48-related protein [bacterium]
MRKRIGVRFIISLLSIITFILHTPLTANDRLEFSEVVIGASENLNTIFFAGNNAYIAGDGGAFHWSPTNGNTWYSFCLQGGPDFKAGAGKSFTKGDSDQVAGTLAGVNGALYQLTQKEGEQPQLQQQPTNYTGTFNDVFYTPVENNNSNAWLAGSGSGLQWSPDFGSTWYNQVVTYPNDNLQSIHFNNLQNGWAVGDNGIIYNTTNGGQQWNYIEGDHTNPDYKGVFFIDPQTGWLCGSGGTILQTTNGGKDWTKQTSGTTNTLNDILFTNATTGWVVGDNGTFLFTKDQGAIWYNLMSNTSSNLNKVTKDSKGNLWVAGDNGKILTNKKPGSTETSIGQINFAAIPDCCKTQHQTVYVNSSGDPQFQWTVTSDQTWYSIVPNHGTGSGYFSVFVDPTGLTPGQYSGTISVYDGQDNTLPNWINIYMNVLGKGSSMSPFGSFDTPQAGTTVQGTIPVTGWALDDVGVEYVKLFLEYNGNMSYLGEASFIEGARPDLQQAYPHTPNNQKAGWGYMLLTNFLPNGGNGMYSIWAHASDLEGNSTTLGASTIICDNAHAVKPFGAIDTPKPGGTASGSNYKNCGWVLTPLPNTIPKDGSTIGVYVDGVLVGHPLYNLYGVDLHALDPSNNNADGAAGYFILNTKQYQNGVHTILWTAADNAGNSDGIGSRYFCINNSSNPAPRTDRSSLNYGSNAGGLKKQYRIENISADVSPVTQVFQVQNGGEGILNWQVESDQPWLTLEPTSGIGDDWVYATINTAGLSEGYYPAQITISEINNANPPEYIKVELAVRSQTSAPIGEFNYPDSGRTVSGSINLYGWALDDIGVESVKIYRQNGAEKIYLGDAAFAQGTRPDIATFYAYYPNYDRAGWSMNFITSTLENGEYTFIAEATDFEGNSTELVSKPFLIDNSNAVLPFGSLDNPTEGGIASGEGYVVSGWVLTPQPNIIPVDGSTIKVVVDGDTLGNVTYNQPREDITAQFPGYQNSSGPGGKFILDTTLLPNGVHTITWVVSDNAGNSNERLGVRNFMVLNNSTTTEIKQTTALPYQTDLLPGYPNPFNATTTISYQLTKDSHVSIYIYDILGRKVADLLDNEYRTAGTYKLNWNGASRSGNAVASGVYLLVFKSEDLNKTQKLLLLK